MEMDMWLFGMVVLASAGTTMVGLFGYAYVADTISNWKYNYRERLKEEIRKDSLR